MIWFLSIFGVIWFCGWVFLCFSTSALQQPTLWGKIKVMAVLFFVWPIIVIAIANQGDI